MRIEREERAGWRTCARDRVTFGDCPGYQSEPCRVVVETITRTFGDAHNDPSDPFFHAASISHETLHTLNGEPPTCRHCGAVANLSLEARPTYARLSDRSPDELLIRRDRERTAAAAAQEQLAVGERQAAALEALARGGAPGEVDQLRELAARQSEQIERLLASLGDVPDRAPEDRPRPRKRTSA